MSRPKEFDPEHTLAKATDLFWLQGYHATSIQNLVDHLEINRASLYDTYGGKKQLFIRTLKQYLHSQVDHLEKTLSQHKSVRLGLEFILKESISKSSQGSNRKGCLLINSITEMLPGDKEVKSILVDYKNQFEATISKFFSASVERGEIKPERVQKNLKVVSDLIFTFFCGTKVATKVGLGQETGDEMVELLMSLLH